MPSSNRPSHNISGGAQPSYGRGTGEAISPQFIRNFGDRWEAAWNSHDTDRVLAVLHPEIRWNDTVFWPEVLHGHEAMRQYVDKIWEVMPDCHFREVQLFSAPDSGRALYLFEQTASAPPSTEIEAKAISYGCDIFLGFRDGLLSDYMALYDLSEMMRQFGMLPPRGDRIGGAYLMSLMRAGAGGR